MRTAVVDVGSNSAHVDVVDLVPGEPLRVVETVKVPTRLAEAIGADGRIEADAVERVVSAVACATRAARTAGAEEIVAFATSAVRDAANGVAIVERVEQGDRSDPLLSVGSGRGTVDLHGGAGLVRLAGRGDRGLRHRGRLAGDRRR